MVTVVVWTLDSVRLSSIAKHLTANRHACYIPICGQSIFQSVPRKSAVFDSTIGRWLTKDPKSFDAGDTNLYRFVGNHPSYATDPSGLEEKGKLRSIPRSMLSELQEIHPPLPGETEADYLRAMSFVLQDLPEPVYDVKGKKILYPFLSERRGGFIDGVYYVDRWRSGNLEQPCVVCHGRDALGLLPGLSTTDSFVCGAWYHSGSPGNIVGNQSAGVGSGIFNFFVGLVNIGGYGYQGLSGQDFEVLIDSEAYTEWIRNAIYPDRDPGSLLTTSGEIFGQIVTGEAFGFALGSLISNSNKLNWIGAPGSAARGLKLPATEASLAGSNTLGYTLANGDVFLQPGLTRTVQAHTLRHEGVHAFLSVADDAPLAAIRQRVGMGAYSNSAFFNAAEEILAESIASKSLTQGIRHAFNGAYTVRGGRVVTPLAALSEFGVGATGLGLFGYGAYEVGNWLFDSRE